MAQDFTGKVAIVTGAASGIGAAVCRQLAEGGAKVAVGDYNLEAAQALAGELGEAITARGGTGMLTAHPSRPGRADAVALALVLAVCAGGVALGTML